MEERGFFCFMAPVYLLAPNMLLTFLIIFTPSISPSKTAMPVLKARIMALPDRKSTRLNSSHKTESRMPSSA